eukprot:PhM_4_TR1069/c0_g2_i1/m.83394
MNGRFTGGSVKWGMRGVAGKTKLSTPSPEGMKRAAWRQKMISGAAVVSDSYLKKGVRPQVFTSNKSPLDSRSIYDGAPKHSDVDVFNNLRKKGFVASSSSPRRKPK